MGRNAHLDEGVSRLGLSLGESKDGFCGAVEHHRERWLLAVAVVEKRSAGTGWASHPNGLGKGQGVGRDIQERHRGRDWSGAVPTASGFHSEIAHNWLGGCRNAPPYHSKPLGCTPKPLYWAPGLVRMYLDLYGQQVLRTTRSSTSASYL